MVVTMEIVPPKSTDRKLTRRGRRSSGCQRESILFRNLHLQVGIATDEYMCLAPNRLFRLDSEAHLADDNVRSKGIYLTISSEFVLK